MMFGMKHSLCFTSIVSKTQPSLSIPMKKSRDCGEFRQGAIGIYRCSSCMAPPIMRRARTDAARRSRRIGDAMRVQGFRSSLRAGSSRTGYASHGSEAGCVVVQTSSARVDGVDRIRPKYRLRRSVIGRSTGHARIGSIECPLAMWYRHGHECGSPCVGISISSFTIAT